MSRRSSPPPDGHLERVEQWAGLRAGDPVDVLDARERRATWRFAAHVTNRATSACWIEVVGGRGGDERRRSFRPEQVFPAGSLRDGGRSAASLHDAPGLPLGEARAPRR